MNIIKRIKFPNINFLYRKKLDIKLLVEIFPPYLFPHIWRKIISYCGEHGIIFLQLFQDYNLFSDKEIKDFLQKYIQTGDILCITYWQKILGFDVNIMENGFIIIFGDIIRTNYGMENNNIHRKQTLYYADWEKLEYVERTQFKFNHSPILEYANENQQEPSYNMILEYGCDIDSGFDPRFDNDYYNF